MKTLRIDDTWSVVYDPENNDRAVQLLRHGVEHQKGIGDWKNDAHAMFYGLLALSARAEAAEAALDGARDDALEASHDLIQRVADGYAAGGDGAIACALYLTASNVRAMKGGDA